MTSASDMVANPELAELTIRDLSGENLDGADRLRLLARSYIVLRNWENIHYQYLTGMLTDDEWSGFRLNLKALLQWPTMQFYWANESHYYSTAFQREIKKILADIEALPGSPEHGYVVRGDADNAPASQP